MADQPIDTNEAKGAGEEWLSLRSLLQEQKAEERPSDALADAIFRDAWSTLGHAQAEQKLDVKPPLSSRWDWMRLVGWLTPVAAACGLLLLVWQTGGTVSDAGLSAGKQRTKVPYRPMVVPPGRRGLVRKSGAFLSLLFSRRTAAGYTHKQTARNGVSLRDRDLVLFQYDVPDTMYVMMISLNQKGETTLFVPLGAKKSISVKKKGYLPRTGSLELDDYVGAELFFLVAAPRVFSVAQLKGLIHRAYQSHGRNWHQISGLENAPSSWLVRVVRVQKQKGK